MIMTITFSITFFRRFAWMQLRGYIQSTTKQLNSWLRARKTWNNLGNKVGNESRGCWINVARIHCFLDQRCNVFQLHVSILWLISSENRRILTEILVWCTIPYTVRYYAVSFYTDWKLWWLMDGNNLYSRISAPLPHGIMGVEKAEGITPVIGPQHW